MVNIIRKLAGMRDEWEEFSVGMFVLELIMGFFVIIMILFSYYIDEVYRPAIFILIFSIIHGYFMQQRLRNNKKLRNLKKFILKNTREVN